jgi:CBS domain-containing protein
MLGQELHGVLTAADIVAWAAAGAPVTQAVKDIMQPPPPAVAPQTLVSACVLATSRSTSGVLALTADGTARGGLLRLISAADLQPAFGDNPLSILKDIASATDIEVLRVLHLRARAFLLAQLTEPSAVDWLAAFGDRINISLVKRLLELAGNAGESWTWCFWGAAGRCELLAPVEPGIAVLCPDPADVRRGMRALDSLRANLAECGYLPYTRPEWDDDMLCATSLAWQERFAQWIRDPILSEMYSARPLFDLRPAVGPVDAWQRLERSVRETMHSEPAFQRLLAHDCLSSLPPLTFFQDEVVDDSGERTGVFAVEHRALGPIVEVGRVFGIANQRVLGSSTLERLELARSRTPAHDGIFREASETLRVLLYLQARTGLRLHESGAEILPSQLSRLDRQALKSGFRAIHALLEFTTKTLWMSEP